METWTRLSRLGFHCLLVFATHTPETRAGEWFLGRNDMFQVAVAVRETINAVHDFPMDRVIVERRLYITTGATEDRLVNIYVNVPDLTREFRISLALMSMTCDRASGSAIVVTTNANENTLQNTTTTTTWCSNVEHTKTHVAAGYTLQGAENYSLAVVGNWSNTEAHILATIYYEADSCRDCDTSSFCCENDSCAQGSSYQTRCISAALTCNESPNCGMICENADEACGADTNNHVSKLLNVIFVVIGLLVQNTLRG